MRPRQLRGEQLAGASVAHGPGRGEDRAPVRIGRVHAEAALEPVGEAGLLAAGGQVAQHRPRLDRGKLVRVAEQHEARVRSQRAHQMLHQLEVDHGGLVHDDDLRRDRELRVVAEAAARRLIAEQPVQRARLGQLGREPAVVVGRVGQRGQRAGHRPGQPLRRLAGRRGQGDRARRDPGADQHAAQRGADGGLPGARPAGDDSERPRRGQGHRAALLVGKRDRSPARRRRARLDIVERGHREPLGRPDPTHAREKAGEQALLAAVQAVRGDGAGGGHQRAAVARVADQRIERRGAGRDHQARDVAQELARVEVQPRRAAKTDDERGERSALAAADRQPGRALALRGAERERDERQSQALSLAQRPGRGHQLFGQVHALVAEVVGDGGPAQPMQRAPPPVQLRLGPRSPLAGQPLQRGAHRRQGQPPAPARAHRMLSPSAIARSAISSNPGRSTCAAPLRRKK